MTVAALFHARHLARRVARPVYTLTYLAVSGEFLGEVEALAELAAILNKTDDVALLKSRQAAMAAKVQQHLWSEVTQLYLNFQQDTGTFNTHNSPTSFYPM